MTSSTPRRYLMYAMLALLVVGACIVGYLVGDNGKEPVYGKIEVTEYRVSSKVSGTLLELYVREGDYVRIGDTLAVYGTTQDVVALEKKRDDKSQDALYKHAREAYEAARKSFEQVDKLYSEGLVTEETRNEVFANYKLLEAQMAAVAGGSVVNEMVQRSLVEGEVHEVYLHNNTPVVLGTPIMSIDILKEVWGTFVVHKEKLGKLTVGDEFTVFVPAFNKEVRMKVYYIRNVGTQADCENSSDGDQLVEMKARPIEKMEGLRPDMTLRLLDK